MKIKSLFVTSFLICSMLFATVFVSPATTIASVTEQSKQEENEALSVSGKNQQTTDTYDYSIATFKSNNAIGKYIKIKNLSDTKKQKKMNALLKADAKAIVNRYDTSKSTTFFEMNVKGKYIKDTNLFIVIYTGDYNNLESAYPTSFYYVSVINVNKASRVSYKGKSELAKIKKAIQKGNFTCNTKDKELAAAQKDYLMGLSNEELVTMLSSINFQLKDATIKTPEIFMYKTKATIQMSIATLHVLGDHIEISIKNAVVK